MIRERERLQRHNRVRRDREIKKRVGRTSRDSGRRISAGHGAEKQRISLLSVPCLSRLSQALPPFVSGHELLALLCRLSQAVMLSSVQKGDGGVFFCRRRFSYSIPIKGREQVALLR
jgi:hypothetical protein